MMPKSAKRFSDKHRAQARIVTPAAVRASHVEGQMQAHIGRLVQFLRKHKVFHKLGVLISLMLVGTACYILYHKLHDIKGDELLARMATRGWPVIALSALFV